MKKFYTLVVMAIVAMLAMNVSAKSIKIKTDLENSVYLINSAHINWGNIPTAETEIEWTSESDDMYVYPNSGFEIVDVEINGVSQNTGKVKNYTISTSVADGALVEIKASEVAMKTFTVIGDAQAVYLNYNSYMSGNASNQVDVEHEGETVKAWVFTPNDYSTVYVNANQGYGISKVTAGANELSLSSPSYCSIYSGTYTISQTFVIETYSYAEKRTSSADIEINGDASVVRASRKAGDIDASEFADFKFSAELDLPLVFKHSNYQKDLYKVTVNGTLAQHVQESGQWVWRITELNDGDKIVIDTDYPNVEVPFTFTFVNENTKGVISNFTANGNTVASSVWSAEDYKLTMGSNYSFGFNYSDYTINSVTVNGVAVTSFYSNYSGIVDSEEGVKVVIDATPGEMNKFRFICGDWEHVVVKANYNEVELTGAETEVELPVSRREFQISAKDGYRIDDVMCGETSLGTSFSINALTAIDGVYEISIYAAEMTQIPFNLVLVNEGTEDVISSIYINNNEVKKEVWNAPDYTVPAGAPIRISFNSQDFTINSIKINDTALSSSYGSYYYNSNIPDAAEFKIEIDAKKVEPFNVVINCENWEKLNLRNSSGIIELTGATTELVLQPSNYQIYVNCASGFFVASATANGETLTNLSTINLKTITANADGKIVLDIVVEEFVRDLQMVVFVEDKPWYNSQLTLNPNSSLYSRTNLQPGYNFIKFNPSDVPFGLSFTAQDYSEVVILINGEVATRDSRYQYGTPEEVTDGTVMKIFQGQEPEQHYVTLSVAEDANVNVHADYVTPVSGDFNLHHGSHIVITEKTEEAAPEAKPLAEGETAKALPFKVTVGDEVIPANEKGQVIVPVTQEMSIKVEKEDDPTGVDTIFGSEEVNGAVFNLQGIKVLENASDASRLPAGLYIINGKKVVLK